MNKLEIKIENCYGIGKLEHVFDFSKSNSYLIYAPNGTMKSSFARTFNDLSLNDAKTIPRDRIYPHRKTICDIQSDGGAIRHEGILVVNAEDNGFDASNKISNFIASKELKKQYDDIYSDLDLQKYEFIKKLKNVSQSTDCENEFVTAFSGGGTNTFFESLNSVIESLQDKPNRYDFKYNDIFDKKGNVKKFLDKNKPLLDQYLKNYQNILSNSKFFKKSENSFGTYQANEILNSIEDNSFFEAGHKFILDGDVNIDSASQLKAVVEVEINNIINDAKLKDAFDKVDKSIGANIDLRAFKKVLEKNNLLLIDLDDYDQFKQKVWLSYFSIFKEDALELAKFYSSKKNELEKILKEAKKEFEIWKTIVSKFNSRFYVPFKVLLTNQEDIVLKEETANLEFQYVDQNERPVSQTKETLLDILSKGEQRAYYILQLLFDIEARKANADNLIIFDDIADSFDYKNKYAIIEYIKDLHNSNTFKIIILTHNFDFYRTISSRLGLGHSVYMTSKNENREIKLVQGQYRKDLLKHFLSKFDEPKVFISLIPFVRNLIEYTEDDSCVDYLKLTSCLHLKSDSRQITSNDILTMYQTYLSKCGSRALVYGEKIIIDLILETAQSIIDDVQIDEILLENKIVLSIAIRLRAEMFMIGKLSSFSSSKITSNQTKVLFTEFAKTGSQADIEILDKVNLMTPENIHMNAFMYEPLIDMSLNHLKILYQEVNTLH